MYSTPPQLAHRVERRLPRAALRAAGRSFEQLLAREVARPLSDELVEMAQDPALMDLLWRVLAGRA